MNRQWQKTGRPTLLRLLGITCTRRGVGTSRGRFEGVLKGAVYKTPLGYVFLNIFCLAIFVTSATSRRLESHPQGEIFPNLNKQTDRMLFDLKCVEVSSVSFNGYFRSTSDLAGLELTSPPSFFSQ